MRIPMMSTMAYGTEYVNHSTLQWASLASAMTTYAASRSMPTTDGQPACIAPIISDPAPENGTSNVASPVGGLISDASHRVSAMGFSVGW